MTTMHVDVPVAQIEGQQQLAIAAREDGIRRAEEHADEEWKRRAFQAVDIASRLNVEFTADEVWELLEAAFPDAGTHEPAALGPVFQRAAREGLIVKAGTVRLSRLPRRHRDLTVWRRAS